MNFSSLEVTPSLAIFVVTIVLSIVGLAHSTFIAHGLFRPYWLLRRRQYDTLLLSGFLHADLAHLFFNMMTFYFFGFPLERRIGGVMFLVLYVLGLVVSALETYRKHRNNPEYATLGASGAISAVLFASIIFNPNSSLMVFPLPIPIPAPLFAVGYLGYTYYSARHPHGRINHDAHLGGALLGLLFVAILEPSAYSDFVNALRLPSFD